MGGPPGVAPWRVSPGVPDRTPQTYSEDSPSNATQQRASRPQAAPWRPRSASRAPATLEKALTPATPAAGKWRMKEGLRLEIDLKSIQFRELGFTQKPPPRGSTGESRPKIKKTP